MEYHLLPVLDQGHASEWCVPHAECRSVPQLHTSRHCAGQQYSFFRNENASHRQEPELVIVLHPSPQQSKSLQRLPNPVHV